MQLDENHLGSNKVNFVCVPIFFILDAISESIIVFRGFMVDIIQRRLFICLHHSQSQEISSNGEGSFCSGLKNISLCRSEEKTTVMALARRGETLPPRTAPAGGRTACWRGPGCPPACPPAAAAAVYLSKEKDVLPHQLGSLAISLQCENVAILGNRIPTYPGLVIDGQY